MRPGLAEVGKSGTLNEGFVRLLGDEDEEMDVDDMQQEAGVLSDDDEYTEPRRRGPMQRRLHESQEQTHETPSQVATPTVSGIIWPLSQLSNAKP